MRQFLLILLLLPGILSAQDNAQYDPDFDDNACYTIMDVLALLIILMPDDAGMDSPNPNYDPDSDGDGTIEIGDLIHLLTLFGTCEEAPACSSPSMDGYTYDVVQIGDQCWFAENLRTTTYADGTVIPAGLTDGEWSSTTSGATAVYGEDDGCDNYSPDIDACDEAQSLAEYGRLYNWHSVDDARGLCPSGWHVPTDEEWTDLEDFISAQGFSGTEGTALKSTYGWSNSGNGTDDFGFSALPGGYRDLYDGYFYGAGSYGYWWSSSPSGGNAWYRNLNDYPPDVLRSDYNPRVGFSVRCLRDANNTEVQGCTDPAYVEYDATATTDDGSCATLASTCESPTMDGYSYSVVEIGDQCWFAENLRTTTYADGTAIPAGLMDGDWTSTTSGATAVYGEDDGCDNYSPDIDACDEAQSLAEYGRLYNWYAATDAAGLCPTGWHVPTDEEWTDLEDFITAEGFSGTEGTALKSTYGWYDGSNGTDSFGFSALPGGLRSSDDGFFGNAGYYGYWWSSSPSGGSAWFRALASNLAGIGRDSYSPRGGFSVRCLRDADNTEVQGCTDPAYVEYDATATTDDGSCATLASTCESPTMDGYSYSVVEIGDQCWFAENLRTTTYADGSAIPAGLTDGEWASTTFGATAVYGEGSSDCYNLSPDIDACDEVQSLAEYGRLYNWHAVDDARGLCPVGWHVPTDEEWTDLEDFITAQGFSGTEGTALKSTYGWNYGGNGTDDFGFSALPGGRRDLWDGYFANAGGLGRWWSSSPSGGNAWYRGLDGYDPAISRSSTIPTFGFSVRCLRDAD